MGSEVDRLRTIMAVGEVNRSVRHYKASGSLAGRILSCVIPLLNPLLGDCVLLHISFAFDSGSAGAGIYDAAIGLVGSSRSGLYGREDIRARAITRIG